MLQWEPWLPQVHQTYLCSLGHLLAWKPSQIEAWVLIFKAFDGMDPAWLKDQLWHKDGNRDCQQLHHSPRAVDPSSMRTMFACGRDRVFFENKPFPAGEKGTVPRILSNSLILHIPSLCQDMNQGHSWFSLLLPFFFFYFILSKIVISVFWTHVKSLVSSPAMKSAGKTRYTTAKRSWH